MKALCFLDLINNQITSVPNAIGQLKKLHTLYLKKIKIEELLQEIGDLKNLEMFCLDGNPLEKFPTQLKNLKKLRALFFDEPQKVTFVN
jgi:leucine-rich repeat protein SHOC2